MFHIYVCALSPNLLCILPTFLIAEVTTIWGESQEHGFWGPDCLALYPALPCTNSISSSLSVSSCTTGITREPISLDRYVDVQESMHVKQLVNKCYLCAGSLYQTHMRIDIFMLESLPFSVKIHQCSDGSGIFVNGGASPTHLCLISRRCWRTGGLSLPSTFFSP